MNTASTSLLKRASALRIETTSTSRPILHLHPCPRPRNLTCQHSRFNSTQSSPHEPTSATRRRIKIHPIFWIAIGSLMLYPTYMIVEYLASARAFPPSVRKHLRDALRSRHYGRIEESDASFQKAIQAAIALPPSAFAPDALLKVSGIYAEYAKLLETSGIPVMAYEQLMLALDLFGPSPLAPIPNERISSEWAGHRALTQDEYLRAVALNQKLGQLALQLASSSKIHPYPATLSSDNSPKTFLDAAERHLSSALTALLRIGLPSPGSTSNDASPIVVGRDFDLGEHGGAVDRQSLGVTMEALAEVYAKKGQIEYAQQLLVQAISTLIPPDQTPTPRGQCQAAMLMTSVAGYSSQSKLQDARKVSRSWALKALEMTKTTVEEAKDTKDHDDVKQICGRAATVALFNLGMLAEMDSDIPKALDRFAKSLARAREIGFKQGEMQSAESIKRIRYSDAKWTGS